MKAGALEKRAVKVKAFSSSKTRGHLRLSRNLIPQALKPYVGRNRRHNRRRDTQENCCHLYACYALSLLSLNVTCSQTRSPLWSRMWWKVGRAQSRQLRSLYVRLGTSEDTFLTSHRRRYSQVFKVPSCKSSVLEISFPSQLAPKCSGGSLMVALSSISERPHQLYSA